jgi:hypothetical protein
MDIKRISGVFFVEYDDNGNNCIEIPVPDDAIEAMRNELEAIATHVYNEEKTRKKEVISKANEVFK